MKTTDLFKSNRSAKRLNESMEKLFGTRLDLESFDLPKLEDARNKLRTQLSQVRSGSGFNENIENDTVAKAQWMLDAINSEIAERQEFIADPHVAEVSEESDGSESEVMRRIVSGELDAYNVMNSPKGEMEHDASKVLQQMYDEVAQDSQLHPDDDFEEILNLVVDRLENEYGSATDDYKTNEGFGSFEDEVLKLLKRFDERANDSRAYGDVDAEKIIAILKTGDWKDAADEVWGAYYTENGGEPWQIEGDIIDLESDFKYLVNNGGDEDTEPNGSYDSSDDADALASAGFGSDEDYGYHGTDESQVQEDSFANEPVAAWYEEEGDQIAIMRWLHKNAGLDKDEDVYFDGADLVYEVDTIVPSALVNPNLTMGDLLKALIKAKGRSKKTESAPPGAKAERMVKHIKKGYAKDGKLTDKEKSIAYATAWKQHNKEQNESVNTGDNMTRKLTEGEIQQAQSIVTAKTMVDRVGRWIEELSGMENDTLLQLGDQIRDEMSADQAKTFISSVAPAIQQALQNLKDTRETLATGVRMLTGEEQGAEMLGAEPAAGGEEMPAAEPDMMNAGGDEGDIEFGPPEDEFGAADAAAGGLEAAGREQRESIDRSNSLLRVLAG